MIRYLGSGEILKVVFNIDGKAQKKIIIDNYFDLVHMTLAVMVVAIVD